MTAILEPTPTRTARTAAPRPDRRWLGLFAVLAAMIMNLLDSTHRQRGRAGDPGRPRRRATPRCSGSAASYTLAMAVGLLTGGRLGDMFGRRRMLLIGVAGFVAASLLCAVATVARNADRRPAAAGRCSARR